MSASFEASLGYTGRLLSQKNKQEKDAVMGMVATCQEHRHLGDKFKTILNHIANSKSAGLHANETLSQ